MKKLFLVLALIFVQEAKAIEHTVYIEHPASGEDGKQKHSYALEIEELRNTLTLPVEGSNTLRITYNVPWYDRSLIHFILLDVNGEAGAIVDLIVRTRDLRVVGFINGPRNNRILYRFNDLISSGRGVADTGSEMPSWTWPNTTPRNLGIGYDYPSLERVAGQSRNSMFGNNGGRAINISWSGLRSSFNYLSEYNSLSSADKDLARSMIMILIGYFESIRFHTINNEVSDVFRQRMPWTVGLYSTILTNNWAGITEFSRNTWRRNTPEFLSLLSHNINGDIRDYRFTSGQHREGEITPVWTVLAVALGSVWESECSYSSRFRRDTYESQMNSHPVIRGVTYKGHCDDLLMKFGPTYFDHKVGGGIFAAVLN